MSDNAAHGRTTVARCVMILEGLEHCNERSELERAITGSLRFGPEVRLACQTEASGESAERTTSPRMAAYGTSRKCHLRRAKAASGSKADSGKPLLYWARAFLSKLRRWTIDYEQHALIVGDAAKRRRRLLRTSPPAALLCPRGPRCAPASACVALKVSSIGHGYASSREAVDPVGISLPARQVEQ